MEIDMIDADNFERIKGRIERLAREGKVKKADPRKGHYSAKTAQQAEAEG